MTASRRHFFRTALGIAGTAACAGSRLAYAPLATSLAGMAALANQSASAANVSNGYRAVVCLFMAGGNDAHNWIVPYDASGYAEYAHARHELALPQTKLREIAATGQAAGRRFAMPEELDPLRRWYDAGRVAAIANVGPLVRPIALNEYKAGFGVPTKLFSHNDQQSTWQALLPEGARSGWGGRMGDVLKSANQHPVFTAVSAAGNAVFLSGNDVTQYQVGPDGPVTIRTLGANWAVGSTSTGSTLQGSLVQGAAGSLSGEYARMVQRSITSEALLRGALQTTAPLSLPATQVSAATGTSTLDRDPLAKQLRMVAHMISAAPSLGMRRQVFFVQLGGFDTHSNQLRDHPSLSRRVALSMDYFLSALSGMGMLDNVLLFTASDFGRTLVSNGDGSDHGWGSHHFVAGGGVRGRGIFGQFPTTALNTATDVGSGRLLPTTAVTEMAAKLGGWMGLGASELTDVLPSLRSFSSQNLDFV